MQLVFDIEADGLYEDVTRAWCIVTIDLRTSRVMRYTSSEEADESNDIRAGLQMLSSASQLIGHNIIDYDLPALKKLYGWEPESTTKITDTIVLSRLFEPDRMGGHSLRSWGDRLGFPKGDHNDWTQLSEEMIKYCEQDVNVNLALYKHLKNEIKGQSWGESIDLEHEVAKIISEQQVNGVHFDKEFAEQCVSNLSNMIDDCDKVLEKYSSTEAKCKGTPNLKPFKINGDHSVRTKNQLGDLASKVQGPYQAMEYSTTSWGSDPQVKKLFLGLGWQPEEYNYSPKTGLRTGPKLKGSKFKGLPDGLGEAYSERVTTRHRMNQIQGWVDDIRDDGRITAGAITIGTPTARMRHQKVVNVPSACTYPDTYGDSGSPHPLAGQLWYHSFDELTGEWPSNLYGSEMRSLFCAPDGYDIVGHDASGLELRMLAHYMNDPEYTEILLNGDIHTHNQKLAGLPTRSAAKTFIYAFIYGAGDAKLGDIVSGTQAEGAAVRDKFLRENPQLNKLITGVKRKAKKQGYLRGLDGRRIYLRRDDSGNVMVHKALNTLLQCAGAVVMKKSMVILNNNAKAENLDFKKVIDMHDEGQAEVWSPHSQRYAELAEDSVVQAGIEFNMNVPLAAEAKIGKNWAETH